MPGAFQCFGSTGQAPTTVFFGKVPDRLTMSQPYHPTAGGGFAMLTNKAADYVNKWSIFNPNMTNGLYGNPGPNELTCSLGDFIVAPDGTTNTMQKIVETAINTEHYLTAGFYTVMGGGYKLRLAVFAKAAERSRIGLSVTNMSLGVDGVGEGVLTIFDLAGGQIGVPPTSFGVQSDAVRATWTTAAAKTVATILPFGNGVYCCQVDIPLGRQRGALGVLCGFYIDSGTGTGAKSTSYLGDGVSGVYAWKSCLLPPAAWRLCNRVFFDDFTDPAMGTIDLNDTRAPGFNWYIHNTWPCGGASEFGNQVPSPKGIFSQSGSILTITNSPSNLTGFAMASAASLGPGIGNIGGFFWQRPQAGPNASSAYVSSAVFHPPMLAEASFAWDYNVNTVGSNDVSWWTTSLERLYNDLDGKVGGQIYSVENDWAEQRGGTAQSFPAHPMFNPSGNTASMGPTSGYPLWYSTYAYFPGQVVSYLGVLYQSVGFNTNVVPLGNPGTWTAGYVPVNQGQPTTPIATDLTQQNTWHVIWLPSTKDDFGQMVQFFNGIFVTISDFFNPNPGHATWGPNTKNFAIPSDAGNTEFTMGDSQTFPIIIDGGTNVRVSLDWVSITTE